MFEMCIVNVDRLVGYGISFVCVCNIAVELKEGKMLVALVLLFDWVCFSSILTLFPPPCVLPQQARMHRQRQNLPHPQLLPLVSVNWCRVFFSMVNCLCECVCVCVCVCESVLMQLSVHL